MQKSMNETQIPAITEIVNEYEVPKALVSQALDISLSTLERNIPGLKKKRRTVGITDAQVASAYKIHSAYKVPILTLAALIGVADVPLRNRMIKAGTPPLDYREVQRAVDLAGVGEEEYSLAKYLHDFGLSWNQVARISGRSSGDSYGRIARSKGE